MRNSKKSCDNKYIVLLLLGFVGILFGTLFIIHSASISETLDGSVYYFNLNIAVEGYLKESGKFLIFENVQLSYNFTNNRGAFRFSPISPINLTEFSLSFPEIFKSSNVSARIFKEDKIVDVSNHITNKESSSLVISKIHEISENDTVEITFIGNLTPKGKFNFRIPTWLILRPNESNIHFVLGDTFQCLSPCIYDFYNINETQSSFDGDTKLLWQVSVNTSIPQEPSLYENSWFYLNAYSTKTLFNKEVFNAIGVSLLVGALVELIIIVITKK